MICIVDSRALANEIITNVYKKITKFTDIKVAGLSAETDYKWEGNQIIVAPIWCLKTVLCSKPPIDLSNLKMVIIDEANCFFSKGQNIEALMSLRSWQL